MTLALSAVTNESAYFRHSSRANLSRSIAMDDHLNAPECSRIVFKALGPWFHNLHLPDGAQTAPDHFLGDFPSYKWKELAPLLPDDMSDWRVLDIGCNAGFYSIECARRGAQVVGIDSSDRYLEQARWAAGVFEVGDKIEYRRMQIHDLARTNEAFDLVLFLGVFYHLRYPLLALDTIASKVKRLLAFQTLTMPGALVSATVTDCDINQRAIMLHEGWPKMAFIEHSFAGDPTNWWAANHAGVVAMLHSAGFTVRDMPGAETYLCEPAKGWCDRDAQWNRDEYRAATGLSL